MNEHELNQAVLFHMTASEIHEEAADALLFMMDERDKERLMDFFNEYWDEKECYPSREKALIEVRNVINCSTTYMSIEEC